MVRHGEHGTRILPAAVATVILVAGLTIAAAFHPSALTWGFHFLAFLPPAYLAGFGGAVALLLWFALRGDVEGFVRRPAAFMDRQPVAFLAFAVGAFALLATLLRVGAPLLGDSFYLVRNYSEAARGVAPLYFRNEPFATLAFSLLLDLFGMGTFAGFLSSFLGAEILLGAATIVCVFYTLRLLVRDPEDRLLAFGFVMAFPMMQLYFGYVEIYAAVVLAVAAFTLMAALHLTGKLPFRYLPTAFLAVALTHYGTVILLPALLVLAWRERELRGPRELALGAGIAAGFLELLQDVLDGRQAEALIGVLLRIEALDRRAVPEHLFRRLAEILEDVEGALWQRALIEQSRKPETCKLQPVKLQFVKSDSQKPAFVVCRPERSMFLKSFLTMVFPEYFCKS